MKGKIRSNFKEQEPDLMIYGCGEVFLQLRGARLRKEIVEKVNSETTKITQADLSNYEHNHRPVPYSMLKKLALAYGVNEMELLFNCLAKLEERQLFKDSVNVKDFNMGQTESNWTKFIKGGLQEIGMNYEASR